MICRRCGNRIPESLAARDSFQCPNCGRQFGPSVDAQSRYDWQNDDPGYDGFDDGYPGEYDDRYSEGYDDRYSDDYDDRYDADDYGELYDDRCAEDYDDRAYEDDGADAYSDGDDFGEPRRSGMRLVVVLYAVTAALLVLAVVLCIALARSMMSPASAAPASVTVQPAEELSVPDSEADSLPAPDATVTAPSSGDYPTV
ncbi:MAG: hypothetical protein ACI4MF_09110 [Candidatus Faecivicinus sp.]